MNILHIPEGKLLVAPALRGDRQGYDAVIALYEQMKAQGTAQYLVLPGNLIHSPFGEDSSVAILDDLILRADPNIIPLIGFNELCHIYHLDAVVNRSTVRVIDGERVEVIETEKPVEQLEDQIEDNRQKYIDFMMALPYAVTTSNVMINSSGASLPLAGFSDKAYAGLGIFIHPLQMLANLHHPHLLDYLKSITRQEMETEQGHSLIPDFFDDFSPQIGGNFLATDFGKYLIDLFENTIEERYGPEAHSVLLNRFLQNMGQQFVISGYPIHGGVFTVSGGAHLMLSPFIYMGDKPIAVIDAARTYTSLDDIAKDIHIINYSRKGVFEN